MLCPVFRPQGQSNAEMERRGQESRNYNSHRTSWRDVSHLCYRILFLLIIDNSGQVPMGILPARHPASMHAFQYLQGSE